MAERVGPRVVIASVGIGVPLADAVRLAEAVAEVAEQIGYRHLIVENDQVSAILPPATPTPPTYETCPDCQRQIGRYPGGKLYRHTCHPRGARRTFHIELPYRQLLLSENYRLHKLEVAKRVRQLRHDAYYLAKSKRIPRLADVQVTLHWKPATARRRDEENPTPTLKALCDGLVDAHVVDDDTHDKMRKRVAIHQPAPGQKQARLWLVITGIQPPATDPAELADATEGTA